MKKGELHGAVASMAREEHEVSGLNHPGESHEEARVEEQGGGHSQGDAFSWLCVEIEDACSN